MGKPGRKRKLGVKREPNGKISRRKADVLDRIAMEDRETLRPGLEARVRLHGIDPAQCRDQMAGSFVGRLCMTGHITVSQYDAAMTYLEDHRNNLIAIRAPRDPSGVDLNRVQGDSNGENVEFYRRATMRWRDALDAVQDRQDKLRGQGALYAALDYCVIRDVQATHMLEWLREGLTTLVKHYGLGDKAKAA